MHALSRLVVDLAAIQQNYLTLKRQLRPDAACAAVVKADAYGLGMAQVAPALAAAGCGIFFVATLEEGAVLREVLPQAAIGVFFGVQPGEEATMAGYALWPVLNTPEQVTLWRSEAAKQEKILPALLHIDTGMNRLGLSERQWIALLDDPQGLAGMELRYLMSHLACANHPEQELNARQLLAFRAACGHLPGVPTSFANSSGIFLGDVYHGALARPGSALYGINPSPGRPNVMQQAARWLGRILQLREIDTPQGVGYGATHVAAAGTRLATVAAGYADGYMRSLSNRGRVVVGGKPAPVAGRVSMDMVIVDVTGLPEASVQPGQEVELMGSMRDVDALAADAGTIGYEILTGIGARVRREYLPAIKGRAA